MSGLASLSATYTDSEGEEDSLSHNRSGSSEKSIAILVQPPSKPNPAPKAKSTSQIAQLVSYHDDIVISDEEGAVGRLDEKDNGEISLEENEIECGEVQKIAENSVEETNAESDEDDIQLPPEPSGRCSVELQEKILKLHKKMESSSGYDMNQIIQDKKDFRNPSIYEKLIQFCSINELGTNYPPSIYDPERWGKESFYDELSKAQKTEMEKREKERKERTKVEFVSGTAKRGSNAVTNADDSKNRKSKWDQVGGLVAGVNAPGLLRPVGVLQPSLTNSGSKGTVISAFGSLPKRPKI